MNDLSIKSTYDLIKKYHYKYLESSGVILPRLKSADGKYVKDSLVLIKLAEGYPDTKIVSKKELTEFVKIYFPEVTDVQQARHLSMQKGWNILSSTRGDSLAFDFPKNSYKLVDLKTTYPGFNLKRRLGYDGSFSDIKKIYNNRCATCGSEEGKAHLHRKSVITILQKGHLDPSLPLDKNIFPQCQICNRADRNRWIYDKTGRVIGVANSNDGLRIVTKFILKSSNEVKNKIFNILKTILTK